MARDRSLGLKLKAVDKISSVIDRVQNKFPKLSRAIKRASLVSKAFNAQTKKMRRLLTKVGGGMKRFGRNATIGLTLPLLAAGAAGVKAFGDFEQGMKGIEKTTGITGPALDALAMKFDTLSTIIPVTAAEMLELAQAGGQLGVKGAKNIEKFTVVMSKLSRASDVAGEEGAKSIARILKVTGSGIKVIDRFSSALVDLGNNAEASESEILNVSNRIAGAIGRFDVGAEKVLGIATALKSLGKNAESSGSVVGRSFDAIDQAIKGGGISLRVLEKLTGLSGKALEKAFKDDATAVFEKLIIGFSKVQKGGGNLVKVMGALGLQGVRINDILGTLAKRPEELTKNLRRSAKAFAENTALQKEFEIQTNSFNSEMITLSNTFTSLGRMIGKTLAPAVKFLGKIFKGVFNFLRNNPTIRLLVIVFGTLAAAMGPVIFAIGAILFMLPGMISGMVALSAASLPITGSMLGIAAGIIAVIAVITILIAKWDTLTKFFGQNPFLGVIKSAFFLLVPLGQIITAVRLVIAAFKGMSAVRGVLEDVMPKFLVDKILGEKKLGKEKGAFQESGGVPLRNKNQDVSGTIGVNFANAPAGTRVQSNFQGPLDFNLGFAGGAI